MRLCKLLFAFLLMPLVGRGQEITNVSLFTSLTGIAGSWTAMMSAGNSPLNVTPLRVGVFCSNDGTGVAGTWVPCQLPSLSGTGPQIFSGQIQTPDLQSGVRPFIDVRSCGAVCNGTNDDTAAINQCISKAHRSVTNCGTNSNAPLANCSGVVLIPNAVCTASQIVMQSYVMLQGTGPTNSVLVQRAGSNAHFIVGTSPTVDQRMVIKDLYVNGNASAQVGSFDCIHFDGTGALSTVRSPRNKTENVWVSNCGQDGISIFGDAGSDYIINSKGFANGRYGANLDAYDSHIIGGEWYGNGAAGIHTGTHGNGSIVDNKSWGNGTGAAGDGVQINSGNYRVSSLDSQDNKCNGLTVTGANNVTGSDLDLDGNGNTGGGNGCAGLVLSGVKDSRFSGTFVATIDAGTSDYAVAWVGTNTNNWIEMPISTVSPPAVGSYSGTIGQTNTFCSNTTNGCVSSVQRQFLNGAQLRGFSDTGATQKWRIDANIGAFTPGVYTVATLPSASSSGAGAMLVVTDASSSTIGPCVGGGSTQMLAVSNGSAWMCH